MAGTTRPNWEPILTGSLYDQAVQTIRELGEQFELLPFTGNPYESGPGYELAWNPTLPSGAAGVSVGLAYLKQAAPWYAFKTDPNRFLERAIDRVAETDLGPSLYGGFTGVAWALAHVHGSACGDDDPNAEIDAFLCQLLEDGPWRAEWELILGLAGIGVYALERLESPSGKRLLSLVVDRLDDAREETLDGITWWTPPEWLTDTQRRHYPQGVYNLGVSHGVPGVVGFLAMAHSSGAAPPKVRGLLDGAVRWLARQGNPNPSPSVFPTLTAPGVESVFSRLAWCYGDPGIAAVLLLAARATGDPGWEQLALDTARRAATVPIEQSGVVDAGLCHGSAGLGHIFNRLYQATRDPILKQAACYWFGETLRMRRPGTGTFGYLSWEPPIGESKGRFKDEAGLLTGATGIMLALLAAVSPVEPLWDRMLLTAVPALPLCTPDGGSPS